MLSYIELSKKNFVHNIKTLKKIAKRKVRIAFAVKGNAYGHGQREMVILAHPYVDYFIVNSIEELRIVRKITDKPVLLLGFVKEEDLAEAVALEAIFGVFSLQALSVINRVSQKMKRVSVVHIACDAKLGREGFLLSELPEALTHAKTLKHIQISGLYAHFANIEDTTNFTHANRQIREYEEMHQVAVRAGYRGLMTHISATSGLLAYEARTGKHPLIRIGIGAYGLWPSKALQKIWERRGMTLLPVLSWKTHIAQVKLLPKGSTIGYGLSYIAKRPLRIALIPQGYADGLSRLESNNGYVLVKGIRCPFLGRISMNMSVVDISRVHAAQIGDEVVILGIQKGRVISAEEKAERTKTINYEVVTRISPLLPRVIR